MPEANTDKSASPGEMTTRRDNPVKAPQSPRASPREEGASASLSSKKESLDDDRQASTRTSGSARTSVVDDRGLDPLSLHILKRTGTEAQLKFRSGSVPGDDVVRSRHDSFSESITGDSASATGVKGIANVGRGILGDVLGDSGHKKKGLLTRIMGGKNSDESDDESAENLKRTEGLDAPVFSASLGTGLAPAPPKYIRVRSHNKIRKDFDHLFLAQELYCPANVRNTKQNPSIKNGLSPAASAPGTPSALPRHKTGAIWAMKFSRDGKYLAAGGQDMIVRVWSIISTPEERRRYERNEETAGIGDGTDYHQGKGLKLNAPVFMSQPLHEYVGHTADVLDLSWSKNNFLLSSSMDKTVRLWHVTKKECLVCFQHSDFVTAIAFHPRDDRFFLSGSLDCKLRLWSIPDKQVAFWNELPELITAVAFTPDGKFSIAGSFVGLCLFYETDGLRYHTQIHVRSTRGRNSKGSKITGIKAVSMPSQSAHGEVKLLITSNDSRIRMYNFRDKSLEVKYKGNMNTCSQIHATFSDSGKYVICGSEDRKVYIWNATAENNSKKDKRGYEYFEAHSTIVTMAIFAPTKSRQLLANSGDPVYDLCRGVQGGGAPLSIATSSASVMSVTSSTQAAQQLFHPDGNIIVTADYTGQIKVFRQDCAWAFRKVDSSDTSSILLRSIHKGSGSSMRPTGLSHFINNTTSSRAGSTRSSSRRNSIDAHSIANSSQTALSRNLDPSKAATAHANGRKNSPSPIRGRPGTVHSRSQDLLKPPPPPDMARQMSPSEQGLMLQEDGQSLEFYRIPPKRASDQSRSRSISPERNRRGSISSGHSEDDEEFESKSYVSAEPRRLSEGNMICKNCGARTFNAFKVQSGPHKGETKCKHVFD